VKRFEFPLSHVLDFRRRQLGQEEARLEALQAERRALETESGRLERETRETRSELIVTGSADAESLLACDLYLRRLAKERKQQAGRMAEWQGRAAAQQRAVVEARRQVRLLEKLEERRRREWRAGVNREQEELSAELYLARWGK
jgi:flagellar protein FliJ